VALAALLVAYGVSRWLQRAVTRPLAAIAQAAKEVSDKGNYSVRVDRLGDDEVGYLAGTFNHMLAEIETSTRELQRSNAEVLRLNAELEQRVAERTSQLEYTNRELEAFCYSVSHDLRAPLRSIDGFSQALIEDYRDVLDQTGAGYLQRVRNASQRMAQLIDDLLELSRITRREMRRESTDFSLLAQEIVADLR